MLELAGWGAGNRAAPLGRRLGMGRWGAWLSRPPPPASEAAGAAAGQLGPGAWSVLDSEPSEAPARGLCAHLEGGGSQPTHEPLLTPLLGSRGGRSGSGPPSSRRPSGSDP